MSPLSASEGKIKTHWNVLNHALAGLSLTGFPTTSVSGTFAADRAFAVFTSDMAEDTERQRGGRVSAVPLGTASARGSQFWISYLEEWSYYDKNMYWFRSANLTFFQRAIGAEEKHQIFRAEWPGYTDWGAGGPGWQAVGAGHPHWQFDALYAYASNDIRRAEVARLVQILRRTGEVEEFDESDEPVIRELAFENEVDLAWTQMHFALQARWSSTPWSGKLEEIATHAHAPASLKEVRDWLTSVIVYAHQELGRSR